MNTLDLKTRYKPLYNPSSRRPEVVEAPLLPFTQIHGAIEPGHAPEKMKTILRHPVQP